MHTNNGLQELSLHYVHNLTPTPIKPQNNILNPAFPTIMPQRSVSLPTNTGLPPAFTSLYSSNIVDTHFCECRQTNKL